MPPQGKLPQVFETSAELLARFRDNRSEKLIAIVLLQYLPDGDKRLPSVATPFYNLVYQAIP